jgi:hypothetical protein
MAKDTTWKGIREIGSSPAVVEPATANADPTGAAHEGPEAATVSGQKARRHEQRKAEDPPPSNP